MTLSAERPQHEAMDQFEVVDNELVVGGKTIPVLAKIAGQTPFYAYDRRVIANNYSRLRAIIPTEIDLHYAMKANPMPAVVQLMAQLTGGLDVASQKELIVALDTGIDPAHVSFAGPGKSDSDLAAAIAAGVIINLESENEIARVTELGNAIGVQPVVSIRVNPAFELKTSGMKMGGGAKPFGIDEERVPAAIEDVHCRGLDFRGFHIFSGSQNLKSEAIVEAQCNTLALAERLADSSSTPITWLNIGGGLGVPYFPGEKRLDLTPIAENLQSLVAKASSSLPQAQLIMELGRYLVAEGGVYVCEVVDRKESRGETYLVTNGGLHHHLALSGNFGQVIRKNYPVCIAHQVNADELEVVSAVGPLCTPLDILADKYPLPKAAVGDYLVVFQSGAYGFTASPQGFLSHPSPLEILV